jgi:S1-C subfamily serine protease
MLQEVPINAKVKQHFNLANKKGLFVTHIEPDSPGSRSQHQEGDIIINFNDHPVNTTHELFKELSRKEILTLIDISDVRHASVLNFTIAPLEKKAA